MKDKDTLLELLRDAKAELKLVERERDEARERADTMFAKHADTLDQARRERDEAWEQRDKLAEALKQCREDSVELLGERDWWRYEIRSDYQKRYQETSDNVTRADEAIQSLTPNAKP